LKREEGSGEEGGERTEERGRRQEERGENRKRRGLGGRTERRNERLR
jgi:hypothetical protein